MKKNLHLLLCLLLAALSAVPAAAQTITTIAGNGTAGYSGDGAAATSAELQAPRGVAVDKWGNVYIADDLNSCIRKINTAGTISTIAGIPGTAGYSGDDGPATLAELNQPIGVMVDDTGSLYIADFANHRIRKIDTNGIITTIAGNGASGVYGDGVPATSIELSGPAATAIDRDGNLYIAETGSNRIRKVDASGIITTEAGTAISGYSGDTGPAIDAELDAPSGVAVDSAGNIYIADGSNNRVRKVDTAGIITTFAGTGASGYSSDGIAATASKVYDALSVATDRYGNVYISDFGNNRIRKVDAAGIITTIAGNGTAGFSGDGGAATAAELHFPRAITTDASGNVYIVDGNNQRVRKVSNHVPVFAGGAVRDTMVCENSTVAINNLAGIVDSETGQTESWAAIAGSYSGSVTGTYTTTSTGGALIPAGLAYTPAAGFAGADSLKLLVCDGVSSDTILIRIMVTALPQTSPVSGPGVVCTGASITLSDTASGGVWVSSNTTASVTTGTVTGVSGGTDTVQYVVTNACGADTATKIITTAIAPDAGAISGGTGVCTGAAITLADTASGGDWLSSNGTASVTTGTVTGVSTGADTVLYVVTNACGADTARQALTISAGPDAGTITGAATVCAGAVMTLADTVSGGVWSSSNAMAAVTTGTVTGVSTGTATISYIVTNGCGTDTATKSITVNALPDAGMITGTDSVCKGDTVMLTATVSGGAWGSTSPLVAHVIGGIALGVTAGTDTITYTVTNSCGSARAALALRVRSLAECTEEVQPLSNAGSANFLLFPNPATDEVTVKYSNTVTEQTSITITNVTGQTVTTRDLGMQQSGIVVIPVSKLAAGVYMVTLTSGDNKLVKRLVKE